MNERALRNGAYALVDDNHCRSGHYGTGERIHTAENNHYNDKDAVINVAVDEVKVCGCK